MTWHAGQLYNNMYGGIKHTITQSCLEHSYQPPLGIININS